MKASSRPFKHLSFTTKTQPHEDSLYALNSSLVKSGRKYEAGSSSAKFFNSKICPYDNNLISLQVTDRINQFSSRPISEHVNIPQKLSMEGEMNQMKRQIESVKDLLQDCFGLKSSTSRIKSEIMKEVNFVLEQHKNLSNSSLRQAVIKLNDCVKNECVDVLRREGILKRLDDLDKRSQKDIGNCSLKQLKLLDIKHKKIQQQLSNLKQKTQQIQILSQHHQFKTEIKNQLKDHFQNMVVVSNEQKIVSANLQMLKQNMAKMQTILNKHIHELKQKNYTSLSQMLDVKIQPKSPLQKQNNPSNFANTHHHEGSFTFSLQSLGELSPQKKCVGPIGSVNSLKQIKSMRYMIDMQNNLMDGSGNYLVNEDGQQIRLTSEQVLYIQDSNVIKFLE